MGLEVLDAIARSEYADEHEAEIINTAVSVTLAAYAAQRDGEQVAVDEPGASADDAGWAHLEPSGEEADHG